MNSRPTRCFGLIAGLGPEATIHYYRELLRITNQRGFQLNLVMIQADMPRVIEYVRGDERQALAQYFAELFESLKGAGAEIAAIPAVTPHLCFRELIPISPLPLVSMLEAAKQALLTRNCHKVAIFGTRFTIESDLFGALNDLVSVVRPTPKEVEQIHNIYFGLATTGTTQKNDRQELTQLAALLAKRDGVDTILLAGTDFTLLFNPSDTGFSHIDCGQAQIDQIINEICL